MMFKALQALPIPLLSWYGQNARALPWRQDPTPYHVLLSEIMLQQTRVAAVLDYYARFLDALPTLEDLAACPEEKLMKLWQGLGYYSRARNLQKAAQTIVRDFPGSFPDTYEAVRALPGVGDYTAGAVSSIVLGLPTPAVDGNVLRVVARLTGDPSDISLPATKQAYAQALAEVIPVKAPGQFNQAMMELGATVCLPNGAPLCGVCPVRDLCEARRKGMTDTLPVKGTKKPRRIEERRVYLLFRGGRVALRQRPSKGLLAGLWEYPHFLEGEPLPFPADGAAFAGTGKHIFTHIEWHMTAYTLRPSAEPLPKGWVWADRTELQTRYTLPSAFAPFREAVERGLTETKEKVE